MKRPSKSLRLHERILLAEACLQRDMRPAQVEQLSGLTLSKIVELHRAINTSPRCGRYPSLGRIFANARQRMEASLFVGYYLRCGLADPRSAIDPWTMICAYDTYASDATLAPQRRKLELRLLYPVLIGLRNGTIEARRCRRCTCIFVRPAETVILHGMDNCPFCRSDSSVAADLAELTARYRADLATITGTGAAAPAMLPHPANPGENHRG